jgi:hypothetical protein
MIKKLIQRLFAFKDERTPTYGWEIFAMDDRIHLSRRVIEAQRKQMQQLP